MQKNKVRLLIIFAAGIFTLLAISGYWYVRGSVWSNWDYQFLDFYCQNAIDKGHGPEKSSKIVYLDITDQTDDSLDKNDSGRKYLAYVNDILAELGAEAIAYDIVWRDAGDPAGNEKFIESINNLNGAYLPVSFLELLTSKKPFKWKSGPSFEKLKNVIKTAPKEKGTPRPFHVAEIDAIENPALALANHKYGHINVRTDTDGVLRRQVMVLKLDEGLVPAITLAMFLDYVQVPFDEIIVDWGNEIRVPASSSPFMKKDLVIPIDQSGQTFIPFPDYWHKDFDHMTMHKLVAHYKDEEIRDNLNEMIEGNFIFIGDYRKHVSDSETNSLGKEAWKISIHAALMNAMLTDSFYRYWSNKEAMAIFLLLGGILILSVLPKKEVVFYATAISLILYTAWWTWDQMIQFSHFPVFSVGGGLGLLSIILVVTKNVLGSKDRRFVQGAFSRYVPAKIVDQIMDQPEILRLGGEKRVLSVLFSDIAGFTSLSEKMSPQDLVGLLNEYLTEMTGVILEEEGIIDKFVGDAIMAEFGVPIPIDDHADRAVMAGLKMQRRLAVLREQWAQRGLPELTCRVGINSGKMLVGNMGSHQVFDYTVIGDAVNLASRLEGANKYYDTDLMISEYTFGRLTPNRFRIRVLDVIKVAGKTKAVKVYEVYGLQSEQFQPEKLKYYDVFEKAFGAYLGQNFSEALEGFNEALSLSPNDLPAGEMIKRINGITRTGRRISDDWDGSVALTSK